MTGTLFDRARSSPEPRWGTIGELVREAAERSGDREFLRFPGVSLTFGELSKAFIQLASGQQRDTRTAVSLLDHVRARRARSKIPAYLTFVASFPMTPSARVEKRKLLEPGRDQRAGVFDAAASTWV